MMQPHVIAAAFSGTLKGTCDVFSAAFGAFSQVSAPAAVAALWQGAAVALALVFVLRLAPRVSAAHRFAAWATGFAVVAGLPLLPFIAHATPGSQIAAAAPLHAAAIKPWLQLDNRWAFAIAVLWLAASILRATALGFHSFRVRKLWKTATPIQNSDMPAFKVPFGRFIEICTTSHLDRPSVIGFFAPRILIPDWLFERLTPGELEQVVLHEAEHLRRFDDWVNLVQKLALVLFPLNPALAWIERRLCQEREMACDEGVVSRTLAPRAYAACLTSLAERGLERRMEALSLGAWQRRPELVRRVQSILSNTQSLHPFAARVLVGLVGCSLVAASVELARCPQMVAFVAPSQPHLAAIAQIQPGAAPTAYLPQATAGFRAIPVKAILQPSALVPATAGDAPVYHANRRYQPAADRTLASREASGEPRQQLIEARLSSATVSDQESAPKYFVLTTWEEVRTVHQDSGEGADYETGTAMQQAGAATTQSDLMPATQITVTRMIVAVYPAAAAPTIPDGSEKPSNSQTIRPLAPPAASGWLIFQL